MGKFRSKLKGATKGKRWQKGHSSSSNPETRKYRDLAKSRFFQENLGPGNLTTDALKKHNAVQSLAFSSNQQPVEQVMEEGAESESFPESTYKTSGSFASEWSHCSNMSYSRFLKVFRSDSALHKEMLAILAAIAEVIKENGGTETPTEYYCSLLTTLEQILSVEERNEDQLTAVLSLINMGIKTVPEGVLKTSCDDVAKQMLLILNEYSSSENNIIVKAALGILGSLLRSQDLALWSLSSVTQIFGAILNPFCIHSKPKWRKAAQQAAASVVRGSCFIKEDVPNPAADKVAEFCKQILDGCMGAGGMTASNVKANQTTILHLLGFMKEVIRHFSKQNMKNSCEVLLGLMTLNYPLVTSCSLQVLYALFSHQSATVPVKLNGQLIAALYEYQPAVGDTQAVLSWLTVMRQAHIHLADVDLSLAVAALPKIFSCLTQLWLSDKMEVSSAATHSLECLLKDAVTPACETEEKVRQYYSKLASCFQSIEQGLGYQFNNVWQQVLHVIGTMFTVGGRNCRHLFIGCLKSLAELRDSYKFSYNNELEHAVGAAVRSLGPDAVLDVISLKKGNHQELNLDRSWLLPILKENVKGSTLQYWIDNIFPMALLCQQRSTELQAQNDGIGSHSYELLYLQLWNLLPSFCNKPTDISSSFKNVAKALGTAVSNCKDLRLAVMASLRKLIAYAKETERADDLAEIARFDKNYLPILFNVYTTRPKGTDEEGQRLATFDTIKMYLSVAKPELTQQLFTSALERRDSIANADVDSSFVKESILDLIKALIPYQQTSSIEQLYKKFIESLSELKNSREQKKAYKLMEEICSSEAPACKDFLKNNHKSIQKLLMKALNSAAVSSKGSRLRCLNYLVKAQPQLTHESKLIKSVVPEAVICCKDINQKCRAAAYDLLNTVGETLSVHDQLQQFIVMVVAGLAGPTHLVTATVVALTSILHQFSGTLGNENIQSILVSISNLMALPTREVVGACLSFVKMYCNSLPSPTVATSIPNIMKALTSMTGDCKRHFRLKVRDILDRLVRKYGCESITPHIPTSDTIMYKRLRNLRKLNARKKRRNDAAKEEESQSEDDFALKGKPKSIEEILVDSDSDLGNDMETDQPKPQKSKNTWIKEDVGTIVDFTDPKVSSKITATKPSFGATNATEQKTSKDRGFKTASDGRLIIEDNSDSEEDSKKKKKGFLKLESDSDFGDEDSDAETAAMTDNKRKRSSSMSTKSGASSVNTQRTAKYKAGGSGIHRRVARAGSEYKAKKAQGDVKKKGKADPYAYLPLKRSLLNKRKKAKVIGQFKNLHKAAKKGALKGTKAKKRRLKK